MEDPSGGLGRIPRPPLSLDVIFLILLFIIPHSGIWYCNNVPFKNLSCMKWTCIVTRSHYWILGKNVDLLGSPLGCDRRTPPAIACFRGAGGSATQMSFITCTHAYFISFEYIMLAGVI